jgi:hypothetical protein
VRLFLNQLTSPSTAATVWPGRLASVAGLPDFAVTLGELAMGDTFSNSTLESEALPWGVDIMAARGCDFMIPDLVSALAEQNIIKTVHTGAHVFF